MSVDDFFSVVPVARFITIFLEFMFQVLSSLAQNFHRPRFALFPDTAKMKVIRGTKKRVRGMELLIRINTFRKMENVWMERHQSIPKCSKINEKRVRAHHTNCKLSNFYKSFIQLPLNGVVPILTFRAASSNHGNDLKHFLAISFHFLFHYSFLKS